MRVEGGKFYWLFVVSARALDKKNKPFGFSFCFFASWEIFFQRQQVSFFSKSTNNRFGTETVRLDPRKKEGSAWDSNPCYATSAYCSTT